MISVTPLIVFVLVSSITPGPNNLMLLSSGANFGIVRSMPHVLGINLGSGLMVLIVGTGLVELFQKWPLVLLILKLLSLSYLCFLAYRLAFESSSPNNNKGRFKPLSFVEAAAFQWINPKAWAMVLSAVTVYALGNTYLLVALTACLFCVVNLPCIVLWTTTGAKMKNWLSKGGRQIVFNRIMALLLILSAMPILLSNPVG